MEIRAAVDTEIDALATIWYDAWQDAHADILPPALKKLRTRESFRERLASALSSVRVTGLVNEPVGLCIVKDEELYQLFVAAVARGTGVAAALLADAEQQMRKRNVETAWLACAIGNMRAARFYEKHGWQNAGIVVNPLETPDGIFPLEVWRYEKRLR